ncbi:uncharacterized protein LOC127718086 [Mytilus californianus]|uniref:uncharacterized protein LOC127718086 n=1 Tax=Mytilus californianus TaxID=6549 RepID=UPI00224710A2|nr:uncharacterized protein LOC127718086 [Mytilus californianus]
MFPLGKVLVLLILVCSSIATRSFRKLILSVEPNPALIHINAPRGTPILSITGYDAATGQRLEQVQITNTPDAKYFTLKDPVAGDNKWYLYSKQFMNKPLNYVFRFRVYGTHQGTVQDREIKIKVSKPNLYPPVFENQTYEFIAYRKSADLDIQLVGTVKANDADFEMYNSKFDYFIFDTQVLGLFNVDSSGKVIIVSKQNFPSNADSYTFSIVAIDAGSPQKMSNITVNVKISDIPPPDIFCVSVEGVKAKFCWKDPTHGQFVNNYQLQFTVNDKNITTRPVAIHGKRNEICTSVSGQHMERSYRFTVQIFNGTDRSPASVQRFVNISKPGLYGDCLNFSNCSIWKPCKHGKCLTKKDMSYECDCFHGWIGRNCTVKDPCLPSPCMNNGQCTRTENNGFKCRCAHGYFGKYCHQKDSCVGDPCLNEGSCSSKPDGSYECHCRPHFTGQHCEVTDPCSPSPCNHTGLCHRLTNTEYVCSCLQGYYGDDCENINKCELHNPCKSGWCVHIDHNQFNCTCYKGSSGKYCNITDDCMINTCKNGATCVPVHGNNVKKYDCQCSRGYHGEECQHYDPCSSNPCQFGGVCRALSDQLYRCECKQERYGENCQFVDGCKIHKCGKNMVCQNTSLTGAVECLCNSSPCRQGGTCTIGYNSQPYCKCKSGYSGTSCERSCTRDSCLNEGTCEIIDGSYECVCPDNFFGTRCENYDFCNATRMCIRGARCQLTQKTYHHLIVINQTMTANVTNWYTCSHCPVGYTGVRCQFKTDPCDHNLCGAGVCQKQGNSYICICPDNTRQRRCSDDSCPDDSKYHDKSGRYAWPETKVGYFAKSVCPHGSTTTIDEVFRMCRVDSRGLPKWATPSTSHCKQLTASEADMALRNLVAYTGDGVHLTSQEVANVTNQLEGLAAYAVDDVKIAKDMTMVISNLLEARESVLIESNHNNHSSERLVELLHEYTEDVPMNTNSNATIETKNINIMVVNHSLTDNHEDFHYQPYLSENSSFEQGGVSMIVPADVMRQTKESNVRLHFIAYRTSAFFIPEVAAPEEVVLKQRVVTAEIKGKTIANLSTPIRYNVVNMENGRNHTCVYWNTTDWSTQGVYTVSTGGNKTECHTTHLTSFAILMDPVPSYELDEVHDKAMTYISYIGCAVSIFGLAVTIVTYSMFRSLNREKSSRILLNMCVSMLLMNVAFLMMAETTKSESSALCTTIAILLHYFLLTSLMWMLTEAINMYHALITVFTTYSSQFILRRCVIAWGIPLLVVAITMGINKMDNYNSKTDFCFISHASTIAFYIALLGPACCILIINTVVFTLVARVILKPKFRGHPNGGRREKVTPTQVRGAFTVMVLLGVTWVFGPVAINESKIVFNYIFVVLNSLQGFLIFVFRCLLNTEVRLSWLYLLKTGKFKRRRGPIPSTTDSSSSSKALHDSKINNCSTIDSTVDTNSPHSPRNSVLNGNGRESNGFSEYDKNKNKQNGLGLDNFTKI